MKKFIGLVGTNSSNSTNRQLLKFMKKHFSKQAEIELVEIKDIPLFDKPENWKLPAIVEEIAKKIEGVEGVIISTPEYDHSITAVLMNALSWLSYGIYPFLDKPVMITGASYGSLGSSRAQLHLRQILDAPELKARIMPSSEFLLSYSLAAFNQDGDLINPEQIALLDQIFAEFLTFVKITNQLNQAHEAKKKEAKNFSWEK